MAEADRTLKILLQLQADLAGAGQVNAALDQTIDKLKQVDSAGQEAASSMSGIGETIGAALGLGVASAVLAAISYVGKFGEEWRAVDEDINKASADLNEQVLIWDALARGAENFADVVNLASKGVAELTRLSKELATIQAKPIGIVDTVADMAVKSFQAAANFGLSGSGPNEAAKAAEVKRMQDLIAQGLITITAEEKRAKQQVDEWTAALDNPPKALSEFETKLASAKEKLDSIDPNKSVADHEAWTRAAKDVDLLTGQVDKLSKAQEKHNNLVKQLADQEAALSAKVTGKSEDIAAAAADKAYDQAIQKARALGPLRQDEVSAAERIRELTYQTVLAQEQHKGATQGTTAAHQQLRDTLASEKILLEAIRAEMANIESSPFLTLDQKNIAFAALIPQAIDQLNAGIERNKAIISGSALDPAQFNSIQSAIQRSEAEISKLQIKLQTTTFGGQFRANLVQWVNQFGTTATQLGNIITSTIGTAVNGVSNAITSAIFKTQSWGQAFAQVAQSIIGNLINMVLQWAVSRAAMALLNLAYGQAEAVGITAAAQAATTSWAPAAISASIASYGAAAGAGNLAYIAALTSGTAFATGLSAAGAAFETGGYTGPGGSSQVAGIVHRGEYVMPKSTVDRIGPGAMDRFRSSVESGGRGGGGIAIFNFTDMRALEKAFLASGAAKKMIVHTVNSAGGNLRT